MRPILCLTAFLIEGIATSLYATEVTDVGSRTVLRDATFSPPVMQGSGDELMCLITGGYINVVDLQIPVNLLDQFYLFHVEGRVVVDHSTQEPTVVSPPVLPLSTTELEDTLLEHVEAERACWCVDLTQDTNGVQYCVTAYVSPAPAAPLVGSFAPKEWAWSY